jgi:hypothetical protein
MAYVAYRRLLRDICQRLGGEGRGVFAIDNIFDEIYSNVFWTMPRRSCVSTPPFQC